MSLNVSIKPNFNKSSSFIWYSHLFHRSWANEILIKCDKENCQSSELLTHHYCVLYKDDKFPFQCHSHLTLQFCRGARGTRCGGGGSAGTKWMCHRLNHDDTFSAMWNQSVWGLELAHEERTDFTTAHAREGLTVSHKNPCFVLRNRPPLHFYSITLGSLTLKKQKLNFCVLQFWMYFFRKQR